MRERRQEYKAAHQQSQASGAWDMEPQAETPARAYLTASIFN